jgi:hypothetical protein
MRSLRHLQDRHFTCTEIQRSKINRSLFLIPHRLCEALVSRKRIARYSRRGNHFPRLCFRTVRESFPSHGSSVIRPLSWVPSWACDLHVGASPFRVIHTSLNGVLTASAALLVPITDIPPSPRQPIRWLSQRPSLLGESHHCAVCG